MKIKLFISGMITFFVFVIVASGLMAGTAPDNPVHARRKAWHDQNKEVYKGERIIENSYVDKQDQGSSTTEEKKSDKGDQDRLAVLMKEFDKDGDGVISAEEMKMARLAGKGKELKALLEKTKAKKGKPKSDKDKSATKSADTEDNGQEG